MDFNKVRVISFAVRNRLAGYTLVKNPKKKSPYYVKMVKTWHGINDELDAFEHKYIISRDFSKKGTGTDRKTFQRTRYVFWKDKNDKKVIYNMHYLHEKPDGTSSVPKNFGPEVDYNELGKRDLGYINSIQGIDGYNPEHLPILTSDIETVGDMEKNMFWRAIHKRENTQGDNSFWTTLRYNLFKK